MYRCNSNSCCCKRNCCNNNNKSDNCNSSNTAIETSCDDYAKCPCSNANNNMNSCGCGSNTSKKIFPSNPMLGQSYVPIQYMDKTFTPMCALKKGSLFPELVNTYYPGQSMMEIDYLKMADCSGSEV